MYRFILDDNEYQLPMNFIVSLLIFDESTKVIFELNYENLFISEVFLFLMDEGTHASPSLYFFIIQLSGQLKVQFMFRDY